MAKYSKFQRKSEAKPEMAPIWRGIGCILIIIVPLMSYGLTALLSPVLAGSGLVPPELMGKIELPTWALRTPALNEITSFIGGISDLWLKLIVFFIILLLMVSITSLIYSMVFQVVGPPRYTELDAPPSRRKVKVYKR